MLAAGGGGPEGDAPDRDAGRAGSSGAGDGGELPELYRRYRVRMLHRVITLGHDPQQAEDVVQDVMVQLWQYPHRYDPSRGPVGSFLMLQCHGRAIDLKRSDLARRRRQRLVAAPSVSPGDPVADGTVAALRVAKLASVMGRLPDVESEAIRLAFFGDRTYREVADLLDLPEGTVKSRIRAGLRRLKQLLDE